MTLRKLLESVREEFVERLDGVSSPEETLLAFDQAVQSVLSRIQESSSK